MYLCMYVCVCALCVCCVCMCVCVVCMYVLMRQWLDADPCIEGLDADPCIHSTSQYLTICSSCQPTLTEQIKPTSLHTHVDFRHMAPIILLQHPAMYYAHMQHFACTHFLPSNCASSDVRPFTKAIQSFQTWLLECLVVLKIICHCYIEGGGLYLNTGELHIIFSML